MFKFAADDLDDEIFNFPPQYPEPITFPTSLELQMPVPQRPLTILSDAKFIVDGMHTSMSGASNSSAEGETSRSLPSGRKSLSRKRSPDHIPRPPNPFILFACHVRSLQVYKGMNNRELSKKAGSMWNDLTESERATWKAEAQKAKESHAQRYPDYRYRPRRRGSAPSTELPSDVVEGKKGTRATRRRPPPLTLQPEVLYPAECFPGAISDLEALQTSANAFSANMQVDYPISNSNGNYPPVLDHSRGDGRVTGPISPVDLSGFQLLSLQTPPVNVEFQRVNFSAAYPSPISPPLPTFQSNFAVPPNITQSQTSTYYRFQ